MGLAVSERGLCEAIGYCPENARKISENWEALARRNKTIYKFK